MTDDDKLLDSTGELLHTEETFEHEKVEHHELEQRGNDLICTSCTSQHGQVGFFAPGERLSRDEDGNYKKLTKQEDAVLRTH